MSGPYLIGNQTEVLILSKASILRGTPPDRSVRLGGAQAALTSPRISTVGIEPVTGRSRAKLLSLARARSAFPVTLR